MIYVKDFYDKYFLKYPQNIGKIDKNIYLITEDLDVLEEALKKLKDYIFII